MNDFPVFSDLAALPAASNPDWARTGRERWSEACGASDDPAIKAFGAALLKSADAESLLDAVFGNSPFLTQCAIRDPAFFREILTAGPAAAHERAMSALSELADHIADRGEFMALLRRHRRKVALAVGSAPAPLP